MVQIEYYSSSAFTNIIIPIVTVIIIITIIVFFILFLLILLLFLVFKNISWETLQLMRNGFVVITIVIFAVFIGNFY